MKSKVLDFLINCVLSAAALGALALVAAAVLSINMFFPEIRPVISGGTGTASQESVQVYAEAPAEKCQVDSGAASRPENTGRSPQSAGDLDHAFQRFLSDKGLPPVDLQDVMPPESSRPEPSAPEMSPVFAAATETLREDYPVKDARPKADGEVWLRLDPAEAAQMSIDDMMSRAAELYGGSGEPLKVVVWAGSRMKAVKTFNGNPIF